MVRGCAPSPPGTQEQNMSKDIFVKVDSPYVDKDGNANFTFGMQEVTASDDSADELVGQGKAEYVNEEDQEAANQRAAEESDRAVQEKEVDNSWRYSSSLGMKFGDANASNNSPHGDTDVSDAVGRREVDSEPQRSLRQRAYEGAYPDRRQAREEAAPDAASSGPSSDDDEA
jgi:hypothetical protein